LGVVRFSGEVRPVIPVILPPNQPTQFYRGGRAIAEFRGVENADDVEGFGPEDWVGSTVTLFGSTSGLSTLPDGRLLRDAIEADPAAYLDPQHRTAYGSNPALLVKLLDAGQRLPVHVHPDDAFAKLHLDCPFGKTEAWLVIGTDGPGAKVFVGFRETADADDVASWVADQNSAVMLAALNEVAVEPGDSVFIPAGTPHAIGAGVFAIELQEPTDFSVMLEWKDFGLADRSNEQLGLPAALALSCLDRTGWDADRLASCVTQGAARPDVQGVRSLLPASADPFFRAEQIAVDTSLTLPAQFSILVVLDGEASLQGDGGVIDVHHGDTVLVPYGAGDLTVTGRVRLVRCLPPALH
jgi:mannose-6-phosphate isomerase